MSNVYLAASRLLLRPWRESDAASLYALASDPEVGTAAGWEPHKSVAGSLEIIRTVFSAPEIYAVTLRPTGQPVGCAGLMMGCGPDGDVYLQCDAASPAATEGGFAEIGYWMGRSYWGLGLMPEAVDLLLRRAFTDLRLSVVWGSCYSNNRRSRRVMEKCGFAFHHSVKAVITPLGDVRDVDYLRITAEEWGIGRANSTIACGGRP